jgi:hypothetical protein
MRKIIETVSLALFAALISIGAAVAQGPGPSAGPGPVPSPWIVTGATISYSKGGITMPQTVTGGTKGVGTLNVSGGFYINGNSIFNNPLSVFAATTSAQLRGVISDETGGGLAVFNSSPTIISPTITTSFTATGLVGLPNLATQAANTVLVNPTAAAASPIAQAVPSCTGPANALQWLTNTGIQCGVITAAASSVAIGTTSITAGTTTRVLYDNAGVLGEYTISGTGSVAMTTSPTFVTPNLGVASATSIASGVHTITSNSASALTVGPSGATNPVLQVDGSTVSQAAGLKITGAATGGTVTVNAIDSGANASLQFNAKGTGTIALNNPVTISATETISSASASSFMVGPTGSTNPVFQVDSSTASQAAGLKVTGAATGGTVAIAAIDSGSNTNLSINAKGTGTIAIGSVSTGAVTVTPAMNATSLAINGATIGSNTLAVNGTALFNGVATHAANLLVNAQAIVTSTNAAALAVGANGATNPALVVDASTASSASGVKITSKAAANGVNIAAISSNANESITLDGKGGGGVFIGSTSSGGVTLGAGGGGVAATGLTVTSSFTATGLVGYSALASAAIAGSSDYYAATASKIVPASIIYPAETTTSYAATTSFDFNTFINTAVTLTGNITTMNVSNVKAGQSGQITFIQDGTGNRTTVWNSVFKFSGGTPILSTTGGSVDILFYSCRSATFCAASLNKAFQ